MCEGVYLKVLILHSISLKSTELAFGLCMQYYTTSLEMFISF